MSLNGPGTLKNIVLKPMGLAFQNDFMANSPYNNEPSVGVMQWIDERKLK